MTLLKFKGTPLSTIGCPPFGAFIVQKPTFGSALKSGVPDVSSAIATTTPCPSTLIGEFLYNWAMSFVPGSSGRWARKSLGAFAGIKLSKRAGVELSVPPDGGAARLCAGEEVVRIIKRKL